jgi:hypothetical protein
MSQSVQILIPSEIFKLCAQCDNPLFLSGANYIICYVAAPPNLPYVSYHTNFLRFIPAAS